VSFDRLMIQFLKLMITVRAAAPGRHEQRVPTARGNGMWSAVQVQRVLERLDPFREAEAAAA